MALSTRRQLAHQAKPSFDAWRRSLPPHTLSTSSDFRAAVPFRPLSRAATARLQVTLAPRVEALIAHSVPSAQGLMPTSPRTWWVDAETSPA